jgi:hypothetical protein
MANDFDFSDARDIQLHSRHRLVPAVLPRRGRRAMTLNRWLAPLDIALGLGSPVDEVLDALASLQLTESRAHSKIEGVRVYSPAAVALVEQRIRSRARAA